MSRNMIECPACDGWYNGDDFEMGTPLQPCGVCANCCECRPANLEYELDKARFLAKTWNGFRPHSGEIHPLFASFSQEALRKAEEIAGTCGWLEEAK